MLRDEGVVDVPHSLLLFFFYFVFTAPNRRPAMRLPAMAGTLARAGACQPSGRHKPGGCGKRGRSHAGRVHPTVRNTPRRHS